MASSFTLADDPVLYTPREYHKYRGLNRDKVWTEFQGILRAVEDVGGEPDRFARFLRDRFEFLHRQYQTDQSIVDPCFSTIIRAWMQGLERGLSLYQIKPDPSVFQYYCDRLQLELDLALDWDLTSAGFARPHKHGNEALFKIWPVETLLRSRMLKQRAFDCVPETRDGSYVAITDNGFASLFGDAVAILASIDATAQECLLQNIRTVYGCILRGHKTTMGTRYDWPGTVIIAVSDERLAGHDIVLSAAQLYHEHCHNKLSLYCRAADCNLPQETNLISTFKNEIREYETILHTIYTLTMECAVLLHQIDRRSPIDSAKTLAHLADVGFRLEIICSYYLKHPTTLGSPLFVKIGQNAKSVIDQIYSLIDNEPVHRRSAHERAREKVRQRHLFDIGQFLTRGAVVWDPDLEVISVTDASADFIYQGCRHTVESRPYEPSFGGYGRYIEECLSSQAANS